MALNLGNKMESTKKRNIYLCVADPTQSCWTWEEDSSCGGGGIGRDLTLNSDLGEEEGEEGKEEEA